MKIFVANRDTDNMNWVNYRKEKAEQHGQGYISPPGSKI